MSNDIRALAVELAANRAANTLIEHLPEVDCEIDVLGVVVALIRIACALGQPNNVSLSQLEAILKEEFSGITHALESDQHAGAVQ